MSVVLGLKQRMRELTGRDVAPLTESERAVKVCMGEGNFKVRSSFSLTLRVMIF
jgi:hypothetical protein